MSDLLTALQKRTKAGSSHGLAAALVDADGCEMETVGLSGREDGTPIDLESLFEIGSITKVFTGLLLADMVMKREVALDLPISDLLPDGVSAPVKDGQEITLLHLVTHASGLPRIPKKFRPADIKNPYADYTVDNLYDFLSDYKLRRLPGKKSAYSNLGMGLLGHGLALNAGKTYEELLRERILDPLGMKNTMIEVPPEERDYLTMGHGWFGRKAKHWDLPTLAGAGALRSSATDMTVFLKAVMGKSESDLTDTINMSLETQRKFGFGTDIGLAWMIRSGAESSVHWHDGGTGGYRSFLGFNRKEGVGVFVLANSLKNVNSLGWKLLAGGMGS